MELWLLVYIRADYFRLSSWSRVFHLVLYVLTGLPEYTADLAHVSHWKTQSAFT
jgi:hypothetical protein